jgi:predicted Na+-dependent transporter
MDLHLLKEGVLRLFELLVHSAFPAIVLMLSARISAGDFVGELRRPGMLARTLFVTFLVVPPLAAVILAFVEPPVLMLGIILIAAVAPGDSFALLEAESKKGSLPLSAASMVWLCLTMPFTVSIWLWVVSRLFPLNLQVTPLALFKTVAPLTLVPLFAGVAMHRFLPRFSRMIDPVVAWYARIALIVSSVICLILGFEGFASFTFRSVAAIFLVVTATMFLGYFGGGSRRVDRLTLSLTASLGNLAVVILVAHLSYPGVHVGAQAVAFMLLRWAVIMFWYCALRGRLKLKGATL